MKLLLFSTALAGALMYGNLSGWANANGETSELSNIEGISFSALPEVVQKTLKANAGAAEIADVQKGNADGKTVYRGAFRKNGEVRQIFITEEGSLFYPKQLLGWNQLPTAVQESFKDSNQLNDLKDVAVRNVNGRSVYEFSLLDRSQIQFASDGTTINSPNLSSHLAWHELPAAVQNTVLAQVEAVKFESATREIFRGQAIYKIALENEGRHTEMKVTEDGIMLSGAPIIQESAGAPNKLELGQLPVAAQKTVKSITGANPIQEIRRAEVDDQLHYEVGFRKDGQAMAICVGEDGKIIK